MNKQMSSALAQGDQTEVILKSNMDLGLDVRILENEDGSICINAEDTARGFGWTRIANSGNEVIRWERLNGYIKEFTDSYPQVGMNDYIPESLFYRLGMKASNEKAQKFQGWLADEVIPDIRKTGGYAYSGLSTEMKALLMHDKKLKVVEHRLDDLEDNIHITRSQQKQLKQFVNKVVISALGSRHSNAYKLFSGKAFSAFWRDYYNRFNVTSYLDTPKMKWQEALQFVNDWKPNEELRCLILGANTYVQQEIAGGQA